MTTPTPTRLHQLVAAEKDVRRVTEGLISTAYQQAQKQALFSGLRKTYAPAVEDGQQLPGDRQLVQMQVATLMSRVQEAAADLIDFTATKDAANQRAVGHLSLKGVELTLPVTTLLWLEKKLVDIRAFVAALPTLPGDDVWTFDADNGHYVSEPQHTLRQVDEPVFLVASPATDKHPAQVVERKKTTVTGTWTTEKFSGAIPATRRAELVERVEQLIQAVKKAREAANQTIVEDQHIGAHIMGHLFR